jgi:hypothetical protein
VKRRRHKKPQEVFDSNDIARLKIGRAPED